MNLNNSETLAVLFLVALIYLYRQQQAFITLLKYRLRLGEAQRVERSSLPAQIAQLLNGARQELEVAGFGYAFTEARPPLNLFDPSPLYFIDFYWNPEKSTCAMVKLAEPHTGQAVSVIFMTAFADGKRLETINRIRWCTLPATDEYILQDAYADNFLGQWQFHQKALEKELTSRAVVNNLDEALQFEQGSWMRLFNHLQSLGWVREESPAIFRFTAKGAWQYSRQMTREGGKVRTALAQPYKNLQAPNVEAQRSVEMTAFATSVEVAAQPLPQWIKALMFGLTLLASLLLFGRQISFTSAAALLLVLLVHELGHLTAMWAFGFRNLSILFLPFLGAVAMGHKTHVKPWQEAVILLAGPLPGLVLALFATQVSLDGLSPQAAEFFRMCFWFALVLNLFNLLPISLLDGGKLFQLAVLSRFPYARVVFSSVGSTIGLVYSLVNGYAVMSIALVLVLLGMKHQFWAAQAVAAIRARAKAQGIKSLGKEEAVSLLGQHLAQPEFSDSSSKGWLRRTTITRIAYPRLLQGVPGLGTSLGVLVAQAVAFFAPVLIGFALLHQPGQAPILRHQNAEQSEARSQAKEDRDASAKEAHDQFMARYEAERDPEKKWTMLDFDEDEQGRPLNLDPQWIISEQDKLEKLLPDDHPVRLWPLLNKAVVGSPQAAEITMSVITQLTRGDLRTIVTLDSARFGTLEAAYERLYKVAEPGLLGQQATRLDMAWTELNNQTHKQDGRKQDIASIGAHLSLSAGNQAEAETWMDRYLNSCTCSRKDRANYTRGWYLLDTGRTEQALEMAIQELNAPDARESMRNDWRTLAGWAEMARGRASYADAYFQAALPMPTGGNPKEKFNLASWLLGLITGDSAKQEVPSRITEQMLDHLAALESYNPQEAARYRTELADKGAPESKKFLVYSIRGTVEGWGKARDAELGKLAKSFCAPDCPDL